jgi:cytochrome c-type biogenesis protein
VTVFAFALEGRFGYSLLLGMVAAVNPCGFVMLPAYLMYFLGLETQQKGSQRASVERALVVSAATSAGFLSVFLIVGTVSRVFTATILDNAKYASLVIGLLLIVMGGFMLTGWKPPIALPQVGGGKQRNRTIRSMFGFGVAYAIASIGCTIGFLIGAVFGSFGSKGVASGILSVVLYGAGMALIVTALTVTLAFASGSLLRVLRGGLRFMEKASAAFVMLTGLYLTWYWYGAINDRTNDSVTGKVDSWQGQLTTYLQRQGVWKLTLVFGLAVLAGIGYVIHSRQNARRVAD